MDLSVCVRVSFLPSSKEKKSTYRTSAPARRKKQGRTKHKNTAPVTEPVVVGKRQGESGSGLSASRTSRQALVQPLRGLPLRSRKERIKRSHTGQEVFVQPQEFSLLN